MQTKKLMGADETRRLFLEAGRRRSLRGAVARRVALPSFTKAQPEEHPKPIRLEREHRVGAREEQDLLGARIADTGESPQPLLGLGKGEREDRAHVSIALGDRDLRNLDELRRTLGGEDSANLGHLADYGLGLLQDLCRTRPHAFFEGTEGLSSPLFADEVGDVLPEDHLHRIGHAGGRGLAVQGFEAL